MFQYAFAIVGVYTPPPGARGHVEKICTPLGRIAAPLAALSPLPHTACWMAAAKLCKQMGLPALAVCVFGGGMCSIGLVGDD